MVLEKKQQISKMEARPLKTFRTEFSLMETLDESQTITTHYLQQYVGSSSRDVIDSSQTFDSGGRVSKSVASITVSNSREGSPLKKSIIRGSESPHKQNGDSAEPTHWTGTSMQFTEIRSLKRVNRVEEGIGTDSMDIITTPGIRHPISGEVLNVHDAISMRVLDVRTGRIVVANDGSSVDIKEAVRRGIVDKTLGEHLLGPCGIVEDGSGELTLLEAIQRQLLDAERESAMSPMDKEKVMYTDGISVAEAVKTRRLDPQTGVFLLDDGRTLSMEEAFKRCLLRREVTTPRVNPLQLTLSDACDQGLVDFTTGEVTERTSGRKLSIEEAAKRGCLLDVREVVDEAKREKVTLTEALEGGVLKEGKYHSLPLNEAREKWFVYKPMTLKDCCDSGLVEEGSIVDPTERVKMTVLESVARGVVDLDRLKCITDTRTGDLVTLNSALAEQIILPEGQFRDLAASEVMSLPDAVDRGLISSVVQKSIFDIECFKDPDSGVYVSLIQALKRGLITHKGEVIVDLKSGEMVPFKEAVSRGFVRAEVANELDKNIGILPGEDQTVLQAVLNGVIDPVAGQVLDPVSARGLPSDEAVRKGLITPAGATLLNSLLNITVTQQTITQKHYVTVAETDISPPRVSSTTLLISHSPTQEPLPARSKTTSPLIPLQSAEVGDTLKEVYVVPSKGWTLAEAIEQRTFDPVTGLFTIPGTDRLVSLEECLKFEIIDPLSAQVIEPKGGRKIPLLRAVEKQILDSTGHYCKQGVPKITMLEAIGQHSVILEEKVAESPATRVIQVTKVVGKPDVVEVSIHPAGSGPSTFKELKSSEEDAPLGAMQVKPGVIYDPSSALVIFTGSGQSENLLDAIKNEKIEPRMVKVKDPYTGKEMNINQAMRRGIIDSKTGDYRDKAGRRIKLADAAKFGVVAVLGAPLVAASQAVRIIKNSLVIDPKTGEEVPLDEALERRLITEKTVRDYEAAVDSLKTDAAEQVVMSHTEVVSTTVKVRDPQTGTELTAQEAIEKGIINPEELKKLTVAAETPNSPVKRKLSTAAAEENSLSEAELARGRLTLEPKYKVAIGRVRSVSQSPEKEGKPVILQKMRKRVVKPKDAVASGLMDEKTAQVLEQPEAFVGDNGESLTLEEAVSCKKLDGNTGAIRDPQRGDLLTIQEAIDRGVLGSVGPIGCLLLPVGRSLSVPGLVSQGLFKPETSKIVHPETGADLTLGEAIMCEIVDPLSKVTNPRTGKEETLEKAIADGVIDEVSAELKTPGGNVKLLAAVTDSNVFKSTKDEMKDELLPPLGMTFPIALEKGVIDTSSKEFVHPITGVRTPMSVAIKDNLIMALPYPVSPDSVEVTQALECKLIDGEKLTFINPKTGETVPVCEAVETGLLVIKAVPSLISYEQGGAVTAVTETVTSYHTITTKTIELKVGYVLVSPEEVKNLQTGEIMSLDEARRRGIVKDESETKQEFATRAIKDSFSDALARGLIDLTAGTYKDTESGSVIPIQEAIKEGLLDPADSESAPVANIVEAAELFDEKTGRFRDPKSPSKTYTFAEAIESGVIDADAVVYDIAGKKALTTKEAIEEGLIDLETGRVKDPKTGSKISVKEAAKIGLLAIVGAPILAGMAAGKAVKDVFKSRPEKVEKVVDEEIPKRGIEKPLPEVVIKSTAKSPSPFKEAQQLVIRVPLRKAIGDKLIDPADTLVTVATPEGNQTVTLQTALDESLITPDAHVDVLNKSEVKMVSERPKFKVVVSKYLQPGDLEELQVFDPEKEKFLNPETGDVSTLLDIVSHYNIFDPDKVCVKDLSRNDTYVPLRQALDIPLLDRNTGKMVDPATGKRVSFFDAIQLGWIVEKQNDQRLVPTKEAKLTLQDALEQNLFDSETGEIQDPKTGECMTLVEAVNRNVLNPSSIMIRNPENDDILSLLEASEQGIVDLNRGVIINVETRTEVQFDVGLLQGLLIAGPRKPIALEAVIKKGWYSPKEGKIRHPLTRQMITLDDALKQGLVDAFITECKDSKAGTLVSLDDALTSKIVDPKSGEFQDTESGELMPLNDAQKKGLIVTNHITLSLVEAVTEEYYSPKTGRFINPSIGDEQTLQEAVESGFLECGTVRVKDDRNEMIVTLPDAIKTDLVDDEKGVVKFPVPMSFDVAFDNGYLMTSRKPCSLQESLTQGCYDPEAGLIVLNNGERITLDEAMKREEINRESLTVKDPRSGEILTLAEAIKIGVINPKSGTATDPTNGAEMHFYDALERGLIIPAKRKFSLPEAVFKGFYDPKTGKFTSPETKEKLPLERAIKRGMIDPATTMVRTNDESIVTFLNAIDDGIVDAKAGCFVLGPNKKLDFQEAFEQGFLVEIRRPMPLSEALMKGVFDPKKSKFIDPSTGEDLTLAESVETYLIDSDSVHVKDTRSGFWRKLSLAEAMKLGFVDGETSQVKDFSQGKIKIVPLAQAFEEGLIIDSKGVISLQRAIHQGLYDDESGKFTDPNTGRKVTLHEAIRRFIINPQLPCFWDTKSERLLSLVETCRAGIIDRRVGRFKEPGANCTVSLAEAMELGLIVDIESASFGLYEAIGMGLYDSNSGLFVHPATGRKLTLTDSCKEELINPVMSFVLNTGTNRYVKLDEAVQTGVINDEQGVYKYPENQNVIKLNEARLKGLIVSAKKPMSLVEAVRSGLYRSKTGRFIDPELNDALDLSQALTHGLIEGNTSAIKDPITGKLKSINCGIEDGTIDVNRGRVVDPTTQTALTIIEALDKGILVAVERPLTFQQAVRKGSIDFQKGTFKDPRTMTECTLEEAIRLELIDPDSAVVKDPQTGRFHTLKKAITEGLIDLNKRAAFNPQTGKATSLCIIFEQGTVVFLREPLTFQAAIDQNHLNVATGKFTDPQSKEELTLKEAVTHGLIDPDSALIKDTLRKRLVKLPEAFRKGLLINDGDKCSILDSKSSKLCPLDKSLESGLLTTPHRGLSLVESVEYLVYNPATGRFKDPFLSQSDDGSFTLGECVSTGLVDPSSSVVKDPENGALASLQEAMLSELVNPNTGRLRHPSEKDQGMDLVKAVEKGYILAAEARQAMEEKYRLCDDSLQKLLAWIANVEDTLSNQDVVHEQPDALRNQINSLKALKDDLDAHTRPVAACLDQMRIIVSTGVDLLSSVEVTNLEKNGKQLKTRFDRANDRSEKLLRRLTSARDELTKFRNEMTQFTSWLDKARRTLEDKERSVSKLNRLSSSADSTREFVSDVIAHQADLRFITMAAQKFVDESKEYLTCLNDFRTSLPQRLPHIEPISAQDSVVRNEVSVVSAQYRDLLNRANALSDRLSGVGGRQREYGDAVDKARRWLKEIEPRALKVISEPVGADPKTVEDQLHRAKSINNEFVANARLIENARSSLAALLRSLDGQLTPAETQSLEAPVAEVEDRYKQLADAIAEKCAALETALTQSQGVQDALDGLVGWLNLSDNQLKSQWSPASLIKERLEEQIREHRLLQAEIDSHKASIESVARSAQELVHTASNPRLAKKIETKLGDVTSRYEKLTERVVKRGEFLDEVMASLNTFSNQATLLERWLSEILEAMDSRNLADNFARLEELSTKRDAKREPFEETVRNGRGLVSKKDVTDTGPVRDRIKALENQWKELNALLDEKTRLSKARTEQLSAYDRLRDQVLEWLNHMEERVSILEPIALDSEILKKQTEEIKPLIKEHREYGAIVDRLNDLGNAYDALARGDRPESPARRRSSAYSPTKRLSAASPSGSSGFSSRRSSQDGFHLDEVTPVQQQLGEINNRYSLLGVRLTDRQSELDSVREELRRQLDNLRTLSAFLDKVQRNLPKETVPLTKEDADKVVKQIKLVVEEMYEKQSLLDSTKGQISELLRRRPGVRGGDTLKDELTEVVSRWKSLHDACKSRIKFMEDMKNFHDTHDNLNNWLLAKDRMMTVLGPISSDSRMVQSQVQQVQVLREEFRSQQPQLNHLLEVGDSVLSHIDRNSPDGQRIENKLDNIQQRWNDLLAKLEERADSLGAAADSSREFDAGLTRLRDALQAISDQLDDLPLDKDPEEQLRKIENLERQLEGQRPLLADIEAAGAQLCEVLTDPASRAEIQAKLAAVGRQYNTLQKKLDHRKAELEGSLRDGRQFEASCAKTLGWLGDELGSLSERLLVSADRHVLQEQLEKHEPIYKSVMNREHEIIMLLNKGRDMLNRSSTRSDTRNLQRDLDKIQQAWDRLRKDVHERHTRLQTCMEHCRKYYRAQDSFLPWLGQAEDKLETLVLLSFKRKDIERQLKELAAFRNDVWKRSGEYENNRMLGDTFLGACDIDKEIVKNELAAMKQRWDSLNNDLLQRIQTLEETARRLGLFSENLRDLTHGVQRCEDKLSSHDALGGAARDPKMLDRIKSLREEADILRKPLHKNRDHATDLAKEASEQGVDANHLVDEVDHVGDRLEELVSKLDDRCNQLQSAATAVTQFNEQVKGLSHDLSNLENELDAMKAPGRDIKTVRLQLDDVAKFIKKVNRVNDDVARAVQAGEHLVDSGFAPDTAATREQVESLRRQLGRLEERGRNRESDLDKTLQRLEDFYQNLNNIMDEISDASEQVRKLKPVGSEVESIKAQKEEFRSFRRNKVEPLTLRVGETNRNGQGLVQSAAQGVNTTVLEKDLEKLNDRWNDLKERMNERDRRLDVGLLQSGKFQEALDGLAKWLTDTEEMVANQKPPSADYKVVKAQLQEQKFLKKMLLDRQNSMSSLFAMGNEVAAGAEPAERKAIERQLKELMGRFDRLTEGAQQRMEALEKAMAVAKRFQDKLVPIVEWLDKTEKKLKDFELVPTDEEKIQQRIREHDALDEEIRRKQGAMNELTEIASQLMDLVGDDEAAVLADKLTETTDRYTALADASEAVRLLLESSRSGLRHLVLTYQDLQNWMEDMEQRLNRHRALAVHTDRLQDQMEDLADLGKEIQNRQGQIDGTVDCGIELMKHISNDEAIQLKDKLDLLQRRFNDLTSRAADLLRQAKEALPHVKKFHECHNRLVGWMSDAETTLQSGDVREEDIARLEADIPELRRDLDTINLVGPRLCQMSPGEGSATIEGLVTRDNRRFDAIVEQIQRKAERFQLSKQRSLEVIHDIDELLDWFREVETQLRECDPPSADPDVIRVQLKEHKSLNDDISSQKGRVRDVLSTAKKVLRESTQNDDTGTIREKMEDLREVMEVVCGLSADRLGILEQALPLAEHFLETHAGLAGWLSDMEQQVSMLAMPALRPDLIAQQQDRNEMFIQSIAEHKPLVDKLNKTGEALISLVTEEDGAKVQDIMDNDNARYNALRADLRNRQQILEKALQESSQFSDKLEGMLRALTNTADQVNNMEPVSAHPPRIRDQMDDNNALVEDLDKRQEAYDAVKKAANDVINKAGNRADPAVNDIKRKLERLNSLWNEVQRATNDRSKTLDEAMRIAQRFWDELHSVMTTLRDLQDTLTSQEPAAVEPAVIQQQQEALQEIKHEIDQTKPEVDACRQTGQKLMKICGEPDKPEVKKHMEDLDSAWDNITALYAKREENLIDAMEKAMEFHDTLQNLLLFLDKAENKFSSLGPLGSDIEAVKRQISQLKDFKHEVDPHMVKVEALNRQAQELTERTSADQAAAIKEPLNAVNRRWDDLLRGMVERQRQLEHALLRLGQFQHALAELLAWIDATERTLDNDLKPVAGDPQLLEVELAKLKVLVNDIQAHQSSVDTLNDAGRQLIESGKGTQEASSTQEKLSTLNRKWRDLLQKAADRQTELEDALREAQCYHAEIQDLLSWLGEVDGIIAASKPVGGLPETASEQLQRFMEVYNELEENRPKVEACLAQGQEYLKKSSPNSAGNLQHNLRTLKQRWDSVTARANDKKIKLEIALKEATEFHDALQAFVDWLTNAEKILSNLKPVSRVMETILSQIEEHKSFQKDVGVHRETMLNLDKKGTHLKYFSQKQDVILIKNLLISVQHRWERVVSKSAERTRALDHGYKEAREFHDAWSNLMSWLSETEKGLEELQLEEGVGNDPERIKQRLAKHRDFQRALSGKQATYDATMRAGKTLKERAPKTDEVPLRNMMTQLKNKWNAVCAMSVDRQRRLEEALLYCGQFKDAVQALMDWLQKMEKVLAEEGPVHGDLDTVTALVETHKAFEQDLKNREAQMDSVKRTGKELMDKASAADAATIRSQLNELSSLWDRVGRLADRKTKRLEDALREAEQLHKAVHMLLEWLSDAEMKLRFAGTLPEDEEETRRQLAEHEKFMREMREKEREKDSTIALAQRILAKAHPDGATVIKHWITIIQSRWEEVSSWAKQRDQRLQEHLRSLRDLDSLLEELLSWLAGLENNLISLESEPLPDDLPTLETLIAEHHEFMENTANRQGEVDSVCKSRQVVKPQPTGKDRKPSKPKTSLSSKELDRIPSPEGDMLGRKGSRGSLKPADNLPHIGPHFPAKGSKGAEPQFRSPRVKLLWDKWRNVWMLSWERQRRLQEKYNYLLEMERVRNFSWDEWRKRFLKFMNHKKSRLTDLFRKMDKNNDGLVPREDFIDGIIRTKFETSRLEMNAVADKFDHNREGFIDWKEFIAALRPDWEEKQPNTEAEKIHDEVKRLVMLCTCRQKFRVFQVGEGKYRFGDSQRLCLVRILRSTVMVRVGGGWEALDKFLEKNDPCRAKGRTNIELREQFILADGVSQSMSAFKPKLSSSSSQRSHSLSSAGPITKVRERSARSIPMGKTSVGRSSFSATSDSLSDNEGGSLSRLSARKSSTPIRSSLTPGGSLPGSRNNSRPASRQGSKPASRHGSNLSLDSTDEGTPSRIPVRGLTSSRSGSASRKLTPMNGNATRSRTPTSGLASPASGTLTRVGGIHRASSIPTLTAVGASPGSRSRIPVFVGSSHDTKDTHGDTSSYSCPTSGARTPSGSSTPVSYGSGVKLTRRPSGASDTSTGTSRRGAKTPTEPPRSPFRL